MAGLPQATDSAWLTQLQRSKLGQHIRAARPGLHVWFSFGPRWVSLSANSNWTKVVLLRSLFHYLHLPQSTNSSALFYEMKTQRWVFRSRHSLLITAGRSCATPTSEWAGKEDFQIQILSLVQIRSQWRNLNHPDICQLPDLWPLTSSPWLISPMNWKHKTLTPIRWYLECQSVSLTFNPGLKYVQRTHMHI